MRGGNGSSDVKAPGSKITFRLFCSNIAWPESCHKTSSSSFGTSLDVASRARNFDAGRFVAYDADFGQRADLHLSLKPEPAFGCCIVLHDVTADEIMPIVKAVPGDGRRWLRTVAAWPSSIFLREHLTVKYISRPHRFERSWCVFQRIRYFPVTQIGTCRKVGTGSDARPP